MSVLNFVSSTVLTKSLEYMKIFLPNIYIEMVTTVL